MQTISERMLKELVNSVLASGSGEGEWMAGRWGGKRFFTLLLFCTLGILNHVQIT